MLNLGAVPACIRSGLWGYAALLTQKVGRPEASERFQQRARWNDYLTLWWDGDGPFPESRFAELIATLDLVVMAILILGGLAFAIWVKS